MFFYSTMYEYKKTSDSSTSNKQDTTSNNGQQEISLRLLAVNRHDAADIPQAVVLVGHQGRVKRPHR